MKKIYFLLLATILAASCKPRSSRSQNGNDKPVITVTLEPLQYFTEAIAGDYFTVVSMVPKGTSPGTCDPAPQQFVGPVHSKAYFRIGYIRFEQSWTGELTDNAPHLQFFDMSQGIDLIYDDAHIHHHITDGEEHPHATEVEPHVWNSTINAQIIVGSIPSALYSIDKNNEGSYMEYYNALCRRTEHIDGLIQQTLATPSADHAFMIYHPVLSCFTRDYGLHQIPIEVDGREPSPTHLRALIDTCKDEKVHVIFVQLEFDRRNAKLIARQTKTRVVDINPLSYDWEAEMMHTIKSLARK